MEVRKGGEVKAETGRGKGNFRQLRHVWFRESLCARMSWEAARPWTKGVPTDHTSAELPLSVTRPGVCGDPRQRPGGATNHLGEVKGFLVCLLIVNYVIVFRHSGLEAPEDRKLSCCVHCCIPAWPIVGPQ